MPTTREVVPNRSLSGNELKRLILADFTRMLDNFGILSPHIAFGRCSYRLTCTVQSDKHAKPQDITLDSRAIDKRSVEANDSLGAVESHPLVDPSPAADTAARELVREVSSPNAERMRNQIPVPILRKQKDGTLINEEIPYPPQPELGRGEVTETDISPTAVAMRDEEAAQRILVERKARRDAEDAAERARFAAMNIDTSEGTPPAR